MADDNKLYIEITAEIKELQKNLTEAEKKIKDFSNKSSGSFKKAAKGSDSLAKGIKVNSNAMQELDNKTHGLGSEFINLSKAAKIGGAAMKTALISTGIGALVVGLGIIIANWDDISEAIGLGNTELQNYLDKLDELEQKQLILSQHTKAIKGLQTLWSLVGKDIDKLNRKEAQGLQDNVDLLKKKRDAAIQAFEAFKKAEVTDAFFDPSKDDLKKLAELRKSANDINNEFLGAQISLAKFNEELAGVTVVIPEIDKAFKKAKNSGSDFFSSQLDKSKIFSNEFTKIYAELIANTPEWLPTPKVNTEEVKNNLDETMSLYETWMADIEKFTKDFATNIDMLVVNNVSNAFAGIGNAIGEALATGGNVIEAMGDSLKAAFGSFLSDMGAMLIEYGVLAIAKGVLDEATWIPGAGIAAGAAAIAVGLAMTAVGGAMGSYANTGSTGGYSGDTAGVGSSGSSVTYANSGAGGGGTYVFEIQGSKLVGVLQNTLARNRSLGGSLNLEG